RSLLVKIYTFLKELNTARGKIPFDACALTTAFSRRFGHISLYSMQSGMRVFQELGLLHGDLEEKKYILPVPKGKMDLMESPSYRRHFQE
ncbi:MAG: single-stranded-DNA-specific exonuclease RecJ, partial [Selenomonadaceae bacterium]|nr:single-stranded-DNA-specific exonuclease RecJ [Selenomonadaceae bacterium]